LDTKVAPEISINFIINLLKRNFALILLGAVLGLNVSLVVTSLFFEKKYTSSVKLHVYLPSGETQSNARLIDDYNYILRVVKRHIQMISTWDFYRDVKESSGLNYSAEKIGSMIKYSILDDTDVFRARVTANNPADAVSIAVAIGREAPKTLGEMQEKSKVKIVESARVNINPVSPNLKKNLAVGLIMGIVLVLALVFMKDIFDVRIKSAEELSERYGVNILAEVSDISKSDRKLKTRWKYLEG